MLNSPNLHSATFIGPALYTLVTHTHTLLLSTPSQTLGFGPATTKKREAKITQALILTLITLWCTNMREKLGLCTAHI